MSAASRKRLEARKAKADETAQLSKLRKSDRRLLLETQRQADEFSDGLRMNLDPAEAVSEVLDNIMRLYRIATQKVFTLREDEYFQETIAGKTPHEWIREQERLSMQAVHVAGKAAGMGLAERQVQIQEAQAAIFSAIVEMALKEAGLDLEQRRKVHESIATGLEDIDGAARDLPAGVLAA